MKLALPICWAIACLGCGRHRVPDDELVVLIESPAQTLDPRFLVGAYDFKLSRLVYAPLVSVETPTLEPKMELAESVVPDGSDWVVTLRETARFSDGRPVEAEDVAHTIALLRDPKTGGAAARLRRRFTDAGLTAVEVVSPKKLILRLSHPHATMITDLDFGILARGAVEPPIGAGAFVLERRDGESWRFRPNPHFYGGAAKLRSLTFKLIRDDNSRLLALVGGSADLTQNTISPLLMDAVAEQPRLKLEHGRSSVYTYLGLNCEDEILKDVRVRRAIAHAIDRERIVRTKFRDRALLATGMLPTFHWAYAPDAISYDYDPQKARQLLDEAGHPDPDGDGPLPRFRLLYKTSSNKFRVAIARVLVGMLAEVGIEVELRSLEFATFFADVKKGNFQIFSMQIPEISEPDLYTHFFASDRVPTRENLDAGANRVRYRRPEIDRLLEEGRRTLDRDKRREIYAAVQKILARDVPVISLWHEDNVAALRREVKGFQIFPTAQLTSLAHVYKD